MFDFGTISFVKKEIEKQSTKESISHPINLIFSRFLTSYQEQTLMLKLWRYSQTTFLQCFCLFCLPFFGNDILWRGHHWVLFEESQTLSRFMHVYKTANTCNIANTDINEMRKFFRLKHKFMQPSCFMQFGAPRYPFVSSVPSWKSVEFSLAGVGIFWPRTSRPDMSRPCYI